MVRKLGIAVVLIGVAAFSPAPINNSRVGSPKKAPQTQAQLAAEQKFNGVVPIVGSVPRSVDEVGRPRFDRHPARVSHDGEKSTQMGSLTADKVGASAIKQASDRVQAEETAGKYNWIIGILIGAAGFGGWKLFQFKVERDMPVPQFSKRFLKEIENGKN